MVKEVPLAKGLVAWVDDDDWPLVQMFTWHPVMTDNTYYAVTGASDTSFIGMHRMLIGATSDQIVDHRDGNGLNNRRGNLRAGTRGQNAANRRLGVNNRSGYKGVCWVKKTGRWLAQINVDKKKYTLGTFKDPWEAAQAYNKAALDAWGEFAVLNKRGGGVAAPRAERAPLARPTELLNATEMTTTEVMWFIGYSSTRGANTWLNRHGIVAQGRRPGFNGENVYLRADVERAKASMPGRGSGGGRPARKSK